MAQRARAIPIAAVSLLICIGACGQSSDRQQSVPTGRGDAGHTDAAVRDGGHPTPGPEMDASTDASVGADAQTPRAPDAGADASVPVPPHDAAAALDGSLDSSATPAADAGPGASDYALSVEGQSCSAVAQQTLACAGHNSRSVLECGIDGLWQLSTTCASAERCDSRVGAGQGKCQSVPLACTFEVPGDICDAITRKTCGIDLLTVVGKPCSANGHCDERGGVHCVCDAGYESDGQGGCRDINDCAGVTCQHGSVCHDGWKAFTCDCTESGYQGRYCETVAPACSTPNSCNSQAYECVPMAASAYTCRGQFADWPMPDAQVGAKQAPSYDSTSTSGVVTDQVTGLIWQRALPSLYYGCTRAIRDKGDSCSWDEANNYCHSLVLAGADDWRLPSKIELESIEDETRYNPAVNMPIFPPQPSGYYGWFWTGSPYGGGGAAWFVSFIDGSTGSAGGSAGLRARCVRGVASVTSTPADHYHVDTGADTVSDTGTGLVWQGTASATAYDWNGAVAYCTGTWRLPTLKELLTLVDPTRVNPCVDPSFPDTPAAWFWTASPASNAASHAWAVYFYDGMSNATLKSVTGRVRCVRE